MLIDLIGLMPVDQQCFLETAAAYFAETLSQTDTLLRQDRYLYGFVRELHEADGEVIGDLVAETMRREPEGRSVAPQCDPGPRRSS